MRNKYAKWGFQEHQQSKKNTKRKYKQEQTPCKKKNNKTRAQSNHIKNFIKTHSKTPFPFFLQVYMHHMFRIFLFSLFFSGFSGIKKKKKKNTDLFLPSYRVFVFCSLFLGDILELWCVACKDVHAALLCPKKKIFFLSVFQYNCVSIVAFCAFATLFRSFFHFILLLFTLVHCFKGLSIIFT